MLVLGVELEINLENMTDLEKYIPIVEKYVKDLKKTPLQTEMTKINALNCSQEEKQKKLQALGTEKTLESFRYMFDLAKAFIATITDDNSDIMSQLGDNFTLTIKTAKDIYDQLNQQIAVLSQEMSAMTAALKTSEPAIIYGA